MVLDLLNYVSQLSVPAAKAVLEERGGGPEGTLAPLRTWGLEKRTEREILDNILLSVPPPGFENLTTTLR